MEITLEKWKKEDAYDLMKICNETDRTYLSNRLPYPYTEENADWWLNMVSEKEGKTAFSVPSELMEKLLETLQLNKKRMYLSKMQS